MSLILFKAVSIEKIWIVPLLLATTNNLELKEKLILLISAFSFPLLTSYKNFPFSQLNILINVPLSEAVANKFPS